MPPKHRQTSLQLLLHGLPTLGLTVMLTSGIARQIDFDQEVALIYTTYADLLREFKITEADADQLRAVGVLKENWINNPFSFRGWSMSSFWCSTAFLISRQFKAKYCGY